jgi:hypothetical protein
VIALLSVARLFAFLIFVALGSIAAYRRDRRSANQLIAYTIAVTLITGFTQRESWPFTTWALFHHLAPERFSELAFEFVDEGAQVHPADARMWQPVSDADVAAWLNQNFERLSPLQRKQFLGAVLARAESARVTLLSTGRSPNEWLLRRFAAPYHFLRPKPWTAGPDIASRRFVGVRLVRLSWNVDERARDPHAVQRSVIDEVNAH